MAQKLKCEYGTINLLKSNPRKITEGSFRRLRESLENDVYMLEARGIVLWRVPDYIPEDGRSPFRGQEGQLVVLGGNQRCRALIENGYDEIPTSWVRLAKLPDGSWWTAEAAERFVLLDNNPEGIAGENDYDAMIRDFNERMMAAAGIDFSNFAAERQAEITNAATGGGGDGEGGDGNGGGGGTIEDQVETGEFGERDPGLEEWIAKRERKRKDLPELNEAGFYLCLVFETHGQKMEFLEKADLLDKVAYEMFVDGVRFAQEKCGVAIERSGLHFPDRKVDAGLAAMAEENDQEPEAERRAASAGDGSTDETDGEGDGGADEDDALDALDDAALKAKALADLAADRANYESCLSWLSEVAGRPDIPKPPIEIENRLTIFREWAESGLERTKRLEEAVSAPPPTETTPAADVAAAPEKGMETTTDGEKRGLETTDGAASTEEAR